MKIIFLWCYGVTDPVLERAFASIGLPGAECCIA
jgi:hypothetical protein